MTSRSTAHRSPPAKGNADGLTPGVRWRGPARVALALAALLSGSIGAFDPVIYRADLTLQVRSPADIEASATSLDAEAREAAVELAAAPLVARVTADVAGPKPEPEQLSPRGLLDGLLSPGPGRAGLPSPLGVEIRMVDGTGRIHLSRRSFSAVQGALVLNTLADEFVRVRVARVAAQEQRVGVALAEVEDQLLANAAAADRLMAGGGAGDHDLLAAAALPAYARLLADLYAGRSPVPPPEPGTEPVAPPGTVRLDQDGLSETLTWLRLRRAELATRYLPDAAPIREVDAALAALEAAAPPAVTPTAAARPSVPRRGGGRGHAAAGAGLAALVRRWSAARSLTPRLEQLQRQAAVLRADAEALSADLARVRLRRLAGPSAGADVDVIERARVPADGTRLRLPLEILAFGLLTALLALSPPRRRPVSAGLPSTRQGALS